MFRRRGTTLLHGILVQNLRVPGKPVLIFRAQRFVKKEFRQAEER